MPVHPISFSIPESKIVDHVPAKKMLFAHIVPGDVSTYVYSDELSYYDGYRQSIFGRTCKKAGWDCLRHYEILANGCIPWFDKLNECPPNTMTHFPKQLVLEAMQSESPESYIPQLLEYTRKHLTTRAMAQYIFDTVGCPTPKRVLFLSSKPAPDYLRCLTLIGMKEILGEKCVDSVHIPHIYEDYPTPTSLYGRGMSYTRILPVSSKSPLVLLSELKEKAFDLIVYGSIHRGMPYWDIVSKHYNPNEIILLCGEDCDPKSETHACHLIDGANVEFHAFIREPSF